MKNSGKIWEIINGKYKGKYCISFDKKQIDHYLKQNRLLVNLFEDKECEVPLLQTEGKDKGKKLLTIEKAVNLKFIGFVD